MLVSMNLNALDNKLSNIGFNLKESPMKPAAMFGPKPKINSMFFVFR